MPEKLDDLRRAGCPPCAADERFLPCNRGILINMDEALKLDSESILMANGMHFPLRQRNRLELINRFTEYQLKRMIRR